jgi:phosphatidylserine/phosphatidylglycerophosphate/cardiolipin synthase-like enzyme
MSNNERTVRSSPQMGITVGSMIEGLLVAELLSPSAEMWLVSPWISDMGVLDNSGGEFDSLVPDAPARHLTLAEILGQLVRAGTKLAIVCRDDPHNLAFRNRLQRSSQKQARISVYDDLHEKTWVGDQWLLTGSMNFTYRGVAVNDEAVTYKFSPAAAAMARLDFTHRWPA